MNYKYLFLFMFLTGCNLIRANNTLGKVSGVVGDCFSDGGTWGWDLIRSTPTEKEIRGHCVYK